jgi:hypothetical protein
MDKNLEQLLERVTYLVEKQIETEERGNGMHTKAPANFSNYTPLHGSGGIFTSPGLEREIITAHVRPFGLASQLELIPSVYQDPRFGAITGFTDSIGDQPEFACEDAPYAYMKAATLTARFGRVRYDTNTIDIDDVMLKLHRGDFTDLQLAGRLLGLTDLVPSGMNEGQVLNVVTMSEMVNVGVQTERNLNSQLWQGTFGVANQFPGLDSQIATGQRDADSNALVPSLDSDVKSFAYDLICGNGRDIVEYLSMLEYYLRWNADTMGLQPVQWVIVMRPQLWFELTACWPCAYNTTKCSPAVATNSTVFLDGRENTTERDNMRNGMYIDINGNRYPVVTDVGIFEHNNVNNANLDPGNYASSIYMVPISIRGGMPVTYREYVDYRQAQPDVNLLSGNNTFFWTDNGVFSWAYEETKWCYKLSLKTEQRVILRAPHLAGRIDYVRYSPLQHVRESDPASPYHADGGVSLRDGVGDPWAIWN